MRIFAIFRLSLLLAMFPAYLSAQQPPQTGVAAIFPQTFEGGKTASGEAFSHRELLAAHRSLPFNTKLRITRINNGKSVIVRVVDRGPFINTHTLDISKAAADALDFRDGFVNIKIEVIGNNSGGTQTTTSTSPAPVLYGFTAKGGGAAQKKKTTQNEGMTLLASNRVAVKSQLYRINLAAPQRKGYAIQLAWMTNNENMLRKVADLQRTFKDVMVNEEPSKNGIAPVYRVLLGPYANEAAANHRLKDVQRFKYEGFVVNLSKL